MDAEGFIVSQLQMHLFYKRKFVAFREAGKKEPADRVVPVAGGVSSAQSDTSINENLALTMVAALSVVHSSQKTDFSPMGNGTGGTSDTWFSTDVSIGILTTSYFEFDTAE